MLHGLGQPDGRAASHSEEHDRSARTSAHDFFDRLQRSLHAVGRDVLLGDRKLCCYGPRSPELTYASVCYWSRARLDCDVMGTTTPPPTALRTVIFFKCKASVFPAWPSGQRDATAPPSFMIHVVCEVSECAMEMYVVRTERM